jgi:hypothetical protein
VIDHQANALSRESVQSQKPIKPELEGDMCRYSTVRILDVTCLEVANYNFIFLNLQEVETSPESQRLIFQLFLCASLTCLRRLSLLS